MNRSVNKSLPFVVLASVLATASSARADECRISAQATTRSGSRPWVTWGLDLSVRDGTGTVSYWCDSKGQTANHRVQFRASVRAVKRVTLGDGEASLGLELADWQADEITSSSCQREDCTWARVFLTESGDVRGFKSNLAFACTSWARTEFDYEVRDVKTNVSSECRSIRGGSGASASTATAPAPPPSAGDPPTVAPRANPTPSREQLRQTFARAGAWSPRSTPTCAAPRLAQRMAPDVCIAPPPSSSIPTVVQNGCGGGVDLAEFDSCTLKPPRSHQGCRTVHEAEFEPAAANAAEFTPSDCLRWACCVPAGSFPPRAPSTCSFDEWGPARLMSLRHATQAAPMTGAQCTSFTSDFHAAYAAMHRKHTAEAARGRAASQDAPPAEPHCCTSDLHVQLLSRSATRLYGLVTFLDGFQDGAPCADLAASAQRVASSLADAVGWELGLVSQKPGSSFTEGPYHVQRGFGEVLEPNGFADLCSRLAKLDQCRSKE